MEKGGRAPRGPRCADVCLIHIGRASRFLLAFFLLGAITPASATVGATSGSFSVSPTGTAAYSVPIAVPPGTAGMEPKLVLSYSSQGGNGIAGTGWSLSGLSAIGRCPSTIAQDGVTRGVQYDANDKFCLDGQRLIAVNGTYGADGTEYRTEIETFTRVISHGTTATGPQWFEAWTKSGQHYEYGNTTDSVMTLAAATSGGSTPALSWAVNKISDTVSNYITFTYTSDPVNGQFYVNQINYTGNTTAGVAPYNSVKFTYQTRPDVDVKWHVGYKTTQNVRLASITSYAGTTIARNYRLAYQQGVATGKSRLISLTECDSDQAGANCLNPTTFGWQEGTPGVNAAVDTGITMTNYPYARAMDVNGDGKTDLAYPSGTTWKVRLSQGSVLGPEIDTGIANTGYQYARPVDINSDGMADLLIPYANSHWYVMQATGNLASPYAAPVDTGISSGGQTANPQIIDMNGDGYPDLLQAHDNYWFTAMGNGTGFAPEVQSNLPYVQSGYVLYGFDWGRAEDFHGLGLADTIIPTLYQIYPCGTYGSSTCYDIRWDVLSWNGSALTETPTNIAANLFSTNNGQTYTVQRGQQVVDFNSDGNTDLLTWGPNSSNTAVAWWLCKNTGANLMNCSNTDFAAPAGQNLMQFDWDGDGKPDMLAAPYANNDWYVFKSSSTGMTLLDSGVPQSGYDAPLVGDVNGDGLQDLMLYYNGTWHVLTHKGNVPDLMISVSDGLGQSTGITYKPITDASVYTKGSAGAFPNMSLQSSMQVVSRTSADNGIGGSFVLNYSYSGAKVNLQGRGFLGFRTVTATDPQSGIVTATNYMLAFPYTGQLQSQTKTVVNGAGTTVTLSQQINTFDKLYIAANQLAGSAPNDATCPTAVCVQYPYVTWSQSYSTDLNGTALPYTFTFNSNVDWYGNIGTITVNTSDSYSKTTTSTYANDATHWILGRLTQSQVASTIPSGTSYTTLTRTSSFQYDPASGLITKELIEPGNSTLELDTSYGYDSFGNKKTVTVSSPVTGATAIASRTSTTVFDAKGQFPVTVTNALSQSETRAYDPRFGTLTSLTGPNGLTTTWSYDGFGRKVSESRADGTSTSISYLACSSGTCSASAGGVTLSSALSNAAYAVLTQNTVSSGTTLVSQPSLAVYDKLKRSVRTVSRSFDNTQQIYQDTQYNANGWVAQTSLPYFSGATPQLTIPTYDLLGRTIKVTKPDASYSTVTYNGLSTTSTTYVINSATGDPTTLTQSTTELKNSQGQVVSVTDAAGKVTTYNYDPFGNRNRVTDPNGNITSTAYNLRGFRVLAIDPDTGAMGYTSDVLGELVSTADAKNQTTTYQYDVLGRMTQRTTPDQTSYWVYDTSTHGIGKLASSRVSGAGGAGNHVYVYDSLGRPAGSLLLAPAGVFPVSITYDAAGRVLSRAYPDGFTLKNIYNYQGQLTEVDRTDTGTYIWKANSVDALGRVTQETFGNGVVTNHSFDPQTGRQLAITAGANNGVMNQSYTYDSIGNVQSRVDPLAGTNETFQYDVLNRLTWDTLGRRISDFYRFTNLTAAYDALGNITNKSDSGAYTYSGYGPHAVSSAGSQTFAYDNNGNMTSGAGRTYTWNAANMVTTMSNGTSTITWAYDADYNRVTQTEGSETTTFLNPRIDLGMHYEQVDYTGGRQDLIHILYAGNQVIGQYTTTNQTGVSAATRYFNTDPLGSIIAMTDETGTVTDRYSYNPWGWRTAMVGATSDSDHGFTGQEHLDMGPIHMNGRLYLPDIGRFISADPIIQAPYNLQSYNGYSYVFNNPMALIDPSGLSAWTDFRDGFLKPVGLAVLAFELGPEVYGAVGSAVGESLYAATGNGVFAYMAGSIAGAAAAGVTTSLITQGNTNGWQYNAMSIAGFNAVGDFVPGDTGSESKVFAHALVGGATSAASGAGFKSGFLSAGFSEAAAPWLQNNYNVVTAAIVGGAASELGGGKFQNGAMTGAFGYLYNKCIHEGCPFPRNGMSGAALDVVDNMKNDVINGYDTLSSSHALKTFLSWTGATLEVGGLLPTPASPVIETAGYWVSGISVALDPSPENVISNVSGLGGKAIKPYSRAGAEVYNQGHVGYSVYDAAKTTKEDH